MASEAGGDEVLVVGDQNTPAFVFPTLMAL
jgi:hypothetical protein